MSERLHIQQSSYSKYETNKADLNLELLRRIQEEFGVDPREFIRPNDESAYAKDSKEITDNGHVNKESYYTFPKEIIDSILTNQQNILYLINMVIKQK